MGCGRVLTFRGKWDSWRFVSREGWPRAFLSFQVFLCHSGINTGVLPPWGLVWRLMKMVRGCSESCRCPWLQRKLTSEPRACQTCTPVERFPQTRTQILALPLEVALGASCFFDKQGRLRCVIPSRGLDWYEGGGVCCGCLFLLLKLCFSLF